MEKREPPASVPQHLIDGWKAYAEWHDAMERAGEPLPPGGVFILNRNEIFADCMLEMKGFICESLQLPPDAVVIQVRINQLGQMEPTVDVNYPDGWVDDVYWKGKTPSGENAKKYVDAYVNSVITRFYEHYKQQAQIRIDALESSRREDLEPTETINLLD
jgi:hypothetical protein